MRSAVKPQLAHSAGRRRVCRLSHALLLLVACFCFAPETRADPGERFLEALSYVPIGEGDLKAALPAAYVDLAAIEAAFGLQPPEALAGMNWHDIFNFVRAYSNRALFFFGMMDNHPSRTFFDFQILWLAFIDEWPEVTSFDLAEIERILHSGRELNFKVSTTIALGRPNTITASKANSALHSADIIIGSIGSFWEVNSMIPSTLRSIVPYAWVGPKDGALVIVATEDLALEQVRLEEGDLSSMADSPLVRAAIASVYSNKEWRQPLANACLNVVGGMIPLDDIVSILNPISAMPPSPLTLVAEQLEGGLGRLSLVAAYSNEPDAQTALEALESRMRRLPASMVDRHWTWFDNVRFAPLPAEGKASRFRPTLLEVLDAALESHLYDGSNDEGVWAASVSLVYPVTPLKSLPKGSRFEDRSINALHIRPVSYQCRFGFLPFVSHLLERDHRATAGRRFF